MQGKFVSFTIRTLLLYLFWILLSGKLKPFHLIAGFLCSAVVAGMSLKSAVAPDRKWKLGDSAAFLFRALDYTLWLLKSVVLAALHVSGLVLKRRMPIAPEIIRHKTILKSDLEKVIFAQSITLTPGTITADIEGDIFTIHRLDEASSGDIDNGVMEAKIQHVFSPRKEVS